MVTDESGHDEYYVTFLSFPRQLFWIVIGPQSLWCRDPSKIKLLYNGEFGKAETNQKRSSFTC